MAKQHLKKILLYHLVVYVKGNFFNELFPFFYVNLLTNWKVIMNYSEFKKVQAKQMLKEKALIETDSSELNFNYCQPNADSII